MNKKAMAQRVARKVMSKAGHMPPEERIEFYDRPTKEVARELKNKALKRDYGTAEIPTGGKNTGYRVKHAGDLGWKLVKWGRPQKHQIASGSSFFDIQDAVEKVIEDQKSRLAKRHDYDWAFPPE